MATAFTMEQSFYTDRLVAHGLSPMIPEDADRAETHRIIYEELCKDVTTAESEAAYIAIAGRLGRCRGGLPDSRLHRGRHAAQSGKRARYRSSTPP